MRHSVISWDCCFRNFFHLIGSLAEQEYPKNDYEFIFVEQRSRRSSDAYNHKFGLLSLQDTVEKYNGQFDVKTLFLDNDGKPYHLGVCNNAGIGEARGKYISVMDGDVLVQPNFLRSLDKAHDELKTIINLDRRYVTRPVGTDFENWKEGIVDFHLCLAECPERNRPVPGKVANKGPLISAPREWWEAVGGYDEHPIWSTGVTRLGQDVTARMEIYVGRESLALPGQFCVHPYHPSGFDRKANLESLVLSVQKELIEWSKREDDPLHRNRKNFADKLYQKHLWAIEANIFGSYTIETKFRLKMLALLSVMKTMVRRLRVKLSW